MNSGQLGQRAYSFLRAGQVPQAISAFQEWLAVDPSQAEGWYNLAVLLKQAGALQEALNAYDRALKAGIQGAEEVHLNKAVIYSDGFRKADLARRELEQALRVNPAYHPAMLNLANLHEDLGERDEASALYERVLTDVPGHASALSRLAALTREDAATSRLIERIKRALGSAQQEPMDRAELGFALARLLDQTAQYDAAYEALKEANRINASLWQGPGFSAQNTAALLQRTKQAFPAAPQDALWDAPAPIPVFILGMYRSGSTLTEQVLAAHPRVQSAGELPLLQQIASTLRNDPMVVAQLSPENLTGARQHYVQHVAAMSDGSDLITDKQPLNFWHVGLIKRLFPQARIIHTVRDARDTAISVLFQHLHPSMTFAHSLESVAAYIQAERELMAHWRTLWPDDILEVRYERLVEAQQSETERLLAFLGLDWSESCIEFQHARTMVRTASVWQVREKMHDRSVGRWRHYERHMWDVLSRLDPEH